VHKLSGSATKVGSSIVLKVMSGDTYNIRASSWWKSTSTPQDPQSPFTSILAVLNSGVAAQSGGKATATELSNGAVLNPAVQNFLNTQNTPADKPKAGLNCLSRRKQ
jgi:hypothetical protein